MKRILLLVIIQGIFFVTSAQQYSLEQCQEEAKKLSPESQLNVYYSSIAQLQEENITKNNLPQVSLSGQLTYQSDVFEFPFSFPGTDVPEIPKEQYRLSLNLQQKIYDGGTTNLRKQISQREKAVNQQQVEVSLYQIESLVNQLYFAALLRQENEKILLSVKNLVEHQLVEVKSGVKHGVLLPSNVNILKKELLSLEQELIGIQSDKHTAFSMLNEWTGFDIDSTSELLVPTDDSYQPPVELNRPELKLFEYQNQQLMANKSLLEVSNRPKLFAFAQGNIGSPNQYNFFETDFSQYYIAGLKLEWNFLDYNRRKNDLKQMDLQSQIIESRKEDFVRKTSISMLQELGEIEKVRKLLEKDEEIIELQNTIVKEAYSQLQNGVITSTHYVAELNNLTKARQELRIHELRLAQLQQELITKSGN